MAYCSPQDFAQDLATLANALKQNLKLRVNPQEMRQCINELGGLHAIQKALLEDRPGNVGLNEFHILPGDFKDRADIWDALGIDPLDVPDSPRRKTENRFSNR